MKDIKEQFIGKDGERIGNPYYDWGTNAPEWWVDVVALSEPFTLATIPIVEDEDEDECKDTDCASYLYVLGRSTNGEHLCDECWGRE